MITLFCILLIIAFLVGIVKLFVWMISAAFHLIPTTVAALRQDYGCKTPFDIMPASWISSAAALTVGLTAAILMIKISEGVKWKR